MLTHYTQVRLCNGENGDGVMLLVMLMHVISHVSFILGHTHVHLWDRCEGRAELLCS